MPNNIIDSIQVSGVTYTIQGSGGGSGNPTVELTQAEYDALVSAGTVSANTYYIITDATPIDISNYWTSAQTQSAITSATSGKVDTTAITSSVTSASTDAQIPTAKAVYDAVGSGGGGKAVSGGTNISITTGETADTINCTLPISTDGNYTGKGIILGNGNSMYSKGANSTIGGSYVSASTNAHYSVGFGNFINLSNEAEFSSGKYSKTNRASSTFGDSGNTLFSVGNGTADNARHNAFEIRQNGDIYLSLNGQDVKLQDHLGGGGGTVDQTIISGSTNAVAGGAVYDKFDEVEQVTAAALNNINDRLSEDEEVTAAGLNAVNSALGGLKLQQITQAAYDSLVTKDASTLYIIVN